MKKRLFRIFILIALVSSLLIGCGKREGENQAPDNNPVSNNLEVKDDIENLPSDGTSENKDNKTEDVENSKEPENEITEDNKEPQNSEVDNTEKQEVPYTTRVKAPFNIFAEPGYDYTIVDTVWEKGLFTIMEEKEDEEGNLWGKLKSGLGWINLTRLETESKLPVRAGLIEKNELPKDYQEVILDDSEYMVRLAFIANENLKDLRFTSIYLSDDGMVDDTLHTFK